ncbi:MAG: hypothetical protein IKO84_00395 [Butyrivibrio sp.]|nr:hypothetical protein [Butyrivibrio sp.]
MKKRNIFGLLFGLTFMLTACNGETEINNTAAVDNSVAENTAENASGAASSIFVEDSASNASTEEKAEAKDIQYDRTYLENVDGEYVYKLTDKSIIEKYDELYADAFADVVKTQEEEAAWLDQSVYSDQTVVTSNLLYQDTNESRMIETGSTFEMDYGFDLLNVGYTYVDLNSDGDYELIFGVLHDKYQDNEPQLVFERAYALVDGKPKTICEGGSRSNYWLGNDGYIYHYGSSGAAFSGVWRIHIDNVSAPSTYDGELGADFVEDEFLGCWGNLVHITEPITDIGELAYLPEYQISEDEFNALSQEWESRQVKIEWIPFGEYQKKH